MFGSDGDNRGERPGLREQYECAANTSDLSMSPHRRGAADIMVASGWTQRMAGGALLRLHTEWIKVKPRALPPEAVADYAATLPARKGKPDLKQARRDILDAYLAAVRQRAETLRGRPALIEHLKAWASEHGVDPEVVGKALTYWLAPQCPLCDGQGKRKMPNTPVLAISCRDCSETGKLARPLGAGLLFQYIEDACQAHEQSLKKRLRHSG